MRPLLLALLCALPAWSQTPVPSSEPPSTPTNTPPPALVDGPAPTPEAVIPRAEPVNERELITRLQIYLDQRNFGPGKIDGRWGEFTFKALRRYQKASGMVVDGKWESVPDLLQISPIYTTYTMRAEDFKQVGPIPRQPSEQAKLKRMPYTDIIEFLGEKYHSDPDFLIKLNADRSMTALKPGDVVRVPNVAPFLIENMKEVGHLPPVPAFATRSIHVDTHEKMLELRDGDRLLAAFPITPGSTEHPAPQGVWHIVGIATMPWYRWNKGVLEHGVSEGDSYDIPAGPNCPVGVLWCGLNRRGVGIHGTNSPDNIGRTGSHGCIRLANWDAARFAGMITPGMVVTIDADNIVAPKPAPTPTAQPSVTPTP